MQYFNTNLVSEMSLAFIRRPQTVTSEDVSAQKCDECERSNIVRRLNMTLPQKLTNIT